MARRAVSSVTPAVTAPESQYRCGFVALVGRPNVGKSTLLNALVGVKIAIVSPKPQTTRTRLLGIKTVPEAELIFIDTRGIHEPSVSMLNQRMVDAALASLPDTHLGVFAVAASRGVLKC